MQEGNPRPNIFHNIGKSPATNIPKQLLTLNGIHIFALQDTKEEVIHGTCMHDCNGKQHLPFLEMVWGIPGKTIIAVSDPYRSAEHWGLPNISMGLYTIKVVPGSSPAQWLLGTFNLLGCKRGANYSP